MEIKRDLYLKKLIDRKQNGLIKVITGIRRCGKSYLLNTIFYNYLINSGVDKNHIIKFAFDSNFDLELIGEDIIDIEKNKRKVNPKKFMDYIKSKILDDNIYYLLFDEVQLLDCFESVLNGYLYMKNVDVYVTGSNAKFLSKDIITEFRGRGDEINIKPLSFSEFMSVYKGSKYDGLNEYLLFGGIPMVVLREGNENKALILKRLFDEIYIKDIEKRYNIRNKSELEDLLNFLSSSIGSLTNPDKLKNSLHSIKKSKITSTTVKKYVDFFEDSFLIEQSLRYDVKGKSYFNTPLKFYFTDLGLRNARINFRQFEETHLMENLIFNELKYRGFDVDVGVVEIKEKGIRKHLEIDFICNLGFNRYYIQSAFSISDDEKRLQEIKPLLKVNDSFKKIIITGDMSPTFYNDNGVLFMNIFDFLLNPNSLLK